MDEQIATNASTDIGDVNVVALTPADMVPAQQDLIGWCDRKLRALADESDELDLHHKLAVENGWKTSVVTSALNRNALKVRYYAKMRAALEAGYLMVPNMPVDIVAIRVKRQKPRHKVDRWQSTAGRVDVEALPAGEGRYVDEQAFTRGVNRQEKNFKGEIETVKWAEATDFDEVDFPIAMVKPQVLDRVGKAMALRVFDSIGRVQNSDSGRDPIFVGRIHNPTDRKTATFFLAWWVDTRTL